MATAFPSSHRAEPLAFRLDGLISGWDPVQRRLQVLERHLWLAPGVSGAGVADGAGVTVRGHQEDLTSRWIVTHLTLD